MACIALLTIIFLKLPMSCLSPTRRSFYDMKDIQVHGLNVLFKKEILEGAWFTAMQYLHNHFLLKFAPIVNIISSSL